MRSIRPFVSLLLLASCGQPSLNSALPAPTRSTVRIKDYDAAVFYKEENRVTSTTSAPPDEVWAVLPEVYETLGIPLTVLSPEERMLGNDGFSTRRVEGQRMSRYLNCGVTNSGQLANIYDVTLSVITRLSDGPEGGANLTSTVEGWATPRVTRGDPVHCTTKGTLEERLVELVEEAFGGVAVPLSAEG